VLCDHGCIATFTKEAVITINKGSQQVLQGKHHANDLWYLDLLNPHPTNGPQQAPTATIYTNRFTANAAITFGSTTKLIQFLHATCFSPTTPTWIKVINTGHFATWPLLTADNVHKFLPKSTATTMGHQDQSQKNYRSTQSATPEAPSQPKDFTPTPTIDDSTKTNLIYASVIGIPASTGQIYTDQTSCFPIQSSMGQH
jgi:hypothetical protein